MGLTLMEFKKIHKNQNIILQNSLVKQFCELPQQSSKSIRNQDRYLIKNLHETITSIFSINRTRKWNEYNDADEEV